MIEIYANQKGMFLFIIAATWQPPGTDFLWAVVDPAVGLH